MITAASIAALHLLPLLLAAGDPDPADWSQFRGPNGSGLAGPGSLPTECAPGKTLAWKAAVPMGRSSPVIAGGLLYLTGEEGDERVVLCLRAKTGETVWRKSVTKARVEVASGMNGPSTPTPVADGRQVVAFFPDVGLLAFDREGKELWRRPLGPFKSMHGISASPVLAEGLVFVLADQIGDSFVAAFRADSGAPVWRAERASGLAGGYSTPSIRHPAGGPAELLVAGALEVTGYEAATGKRLWWATGLTNSPVAVPLVDGNTLFVSESAGEPIPFSMVSHADKDGDGRVSAAEVGDASMARLLESIDRTAGNGDGFVDRAEWDRAFGKMLGIGGLVALNLEGSGDRAGAVRWRVTRSIPYVPSPVLAGGALFIVRDGGVLVTMDPASGRVVRQGRLKEATGKYYASPVAGDGKVILVDDGGKVTVVTAKPEWEEISSGELGEPCQATPAIAGGRIHIRGKKTLYTFAAASPAAEGVSKRYHSLSAQPAAAGGTFGILDRDGASRPCPPYLSSLAGGEAGTGTMTSPPFTIAVDRISFTIRGHDGPQGAEGKNLVALVDAVSGKVLRKEPAPGRDDLVERSLDVKDLAGRKARIQVRDGNSGSAFAWIGVGRIDAGPEMSVDFSKGIPDGWIAPPPPERATVFVGDAVPFRDLGRTLVPARGEVRLPCGFVAKRLHFLGCTVEYGRPPDHRGDIVIHYREGPPERIPLIIGFTVECDDKVLSASKTMRLRPTTSAFLYSLAAAPRAGTIEAIELRGDPAAGPSPSIRGITVETDAAAPALLDLPDRAPPADEEAAIEARVVSAGSLRIEQVIEELRRAGQSQ